MSVSISLPDRFANFPDSVRRIASLLARFKMRSDPYSINGPFPNATHTVEPLGSRVADFGSLIPKTGFVLEIGAESKPVLKRLLSDPEFNFEGHYVFLTPVAMDLIGKVETLDSGAKLTAARGSPFAENLGSILRNAILRPWERVDLRDSGYTGFDFIFSNGLFGSALRSNASKLRTALIRPGAESINVNDVVAFLEAIAHLSCRSVLKPGVARVVHAVNGEISDTFRASATATGFQWFHESTELAERNPLNFAGLMVGSS